MKIRIPEGMLKAVAERWPIRCMEDKAHVTATLEDALGWQDEQLEKMIQGDPYLNDPYHRSESMSENYNRSGRNNAVREIRRMFLAPEPEVPKEIKDLLWKPRAHGTELDRQLAKYDEAHDVDVHEAFRRGQQSK